MGGEFEDEDRIERRVVVVVVLLLLLVFVCTLMKNKRDRRNPKSNFGEES